MKKIVITGANSFIGTSVEKWLAQYPDKYRIDTFDMKDGSWKKRDFSGYDVVFHVAGIAHVSSDPKLEGLYYKVNRDLTIETAQKAKAEGIKQFIFMSSIIVYGDVCNYAQVIEKSTVPVPSNFYGLSKLQAEEGIKRLENDNFKIVVLRPPMVYGRESKGNYQKLSKAARLFPLFPDYDNQRSMLHIDNLCEFVKAIIDNEDNGVFFPQNAEYVRTSEMVRLIAAFHGRKIKMTKVLNPLLRFLHLRIGLLNKVFGNLVYQKEMSGYKVDYRVHDFAESIILSETGKKRR